MAEQDETRWQSPRPLSGAALIWPPVVLWLLVPPLGWAGVRALNQGPDFVCAAVFLCCLMICLWQAHVGSLPRAPDEKPDEAVGEAAGESPGPPVRQGSAGWQLTLAVRNVLVLAIAAAPFAYGYAYWAAHQASLPEFSALAGPAMAQVEAGARAGAAPGLAGKGLRLPPLELGGSIGGSIGEAGEIALVRMQPLTIILLTPQLPATGGSRLHWKCTGAPLEVTEAFCLRVQW